MKKYIQFIGVAFLLFGSASAQKNSSWSDPALQKQIETNIEKYRKGDAVITVVDKKGKPVANATIVVQQQTSEFKFGCNLFVLHQLATPELNRKYEAAFTKLFNFATIPFYWAELEPKQDSLRFKEGSVPLWRRIPPDEAVKWCKEHNLMIKGHPMLYIKSKFMPTWVSKTDPATLKVLAKKRMTELANRYGKDVAVWDVVNEEVARLKYPNVWHQAPKDYLAWAFKVADSLFPKTTTLMINDETKTVHDSTEQYVDLVKGLLKQNVRVDGIGIQFHMLLVKKFLNGEAFTPAIMHNAYTELGKLGKPLWITEITVPSNEENGWQNQAAIVSNIYKLWFSEPQMKGITWWNFGDGTAFGTENNFKGGLLDSAMNPKPAYKVLDQLINHDWKTNLTLTTDAKGKINFRGFYGTYSIEVKKGSKSKKQIPFELKSKNRQSRAMLALTESF
ncbi:endo-1,4-beta-xylanase [Flavisolibacter ginsenosidimutans]|uniref:Glycoside hydrolase family 10 n=1 Tax=Flavisolibacter ginsenosidimutans TaxID=661481 RepID=A0A5B8UJX4_9BACT|nr:endo-1,4-beta-xylanase [Flavisolibacter ginsenosidimutans]QEC56315.1 glycoside hydrolase family 10 [Flavisolibacter ginsenosidimutans]